MDLQDYLELNKRVFSLRTEPKLSFIGNFFSELKHQLNKSKSIRLNTFFYFDTEVQLINSSDITDPSNTRRVKGKFFNVQDLIDIGFDPNVTTYIIDSCNVAFLVDKDSFLPKFDLQYIIPLNYTRVVLVQYDYTQTLTI